MGVISNVEATRGGGGGGESHHCRGQARLVPKSGFQSLVSLFVRMEGRVEVSTEAKKIVGEIPHKIEANSKRNRGGKVRERKKDLERVREQGKVKKKSFLFNIKQLLTSYLKSLFSRVRVFFLK